MTTPDPLDSGWDDWRRPNPMGRPIQVGDAVRVVVGLHNGRAGIVRHLGDTAVYVAIEKPILIARPDGPTEVVALPFSRRELVALRKHEAIVLEDSTPVAEDFRPKHCAGELDNPSGCLHRHPGDVTCGCRQALLGPDQEAVVLQLSVANKPSANGTHKVPFIRHSRESCHQVCAADLSATAVSA